MRTADSVDSLAGDVDSASATALRRDERLRAAVDLCATSPLPMAVYWGSALELHPNAAFRRFDALRSALESTLRAVFERGHALSVTHAVSDAEYCMFSCSAISDDDGVAGVLCVATDATDAARRKRQLIDERHTMLGYLKRLADELTQAVWLADELGTFEFLNKHWYVITGTKHGDDWHDAVHPEDRQPLRDAWLGAISMQATFSFDFRIWHASQKRYRWMSARATAILVDADRRVWLGTTMDIDRHKREEAASQLLALAGDMFNASLDSEEILHELPAVTIGPMADFTFTYAFNDGRMRRIAWAHREASKASVLYRVNASGAIPNRQGHFMHDVAQGKATLLASVNEVTLREMSLNDEHLQALQALDIRSLVAVPIDAGGRVIGALTFARTSTSNPYDRYDLETVRELARRVGVALANADIFQREHQIALSFQDAALPHSLDSRTGVDIRAYYSPARAETQVGGDWYDSVVLPDGRMLLSIGDVSGSGLHAAVVMSMVRHAIRSAAYMHADPAMILEAADTLVRAEAPEHFVTAFVAIIDPITRSLAYCSAGHPPPLVVNELGIVAELTIGSDLPLGLTYGKERLQFVAPLGNDSILVLYTDGLIEGLGNFNPGAEALLRAAADEKFARSADPTALHNLLLPDGARDDVAILTAHIDTRLLDRNLFREERSIVTTLDAVRVRDEIAFQLARVGVGREALENARLIVGEITANVARHAPGPTTIVVDSTLQEPVVHIIDSGTGFWYAPKLPRNDMAEGGRGLFIASLLARRCEISPAPNGGSHARLVIARK